MQKFYTNIQFIVMSQLNIHENQVLLLNPTKQDIGNWVSQNVSDL